MRRYTQEAAQLLRRQRSLRVLGFGAGGKEASRRVLCGRSCRAKVPLVPKHLADVHCGHNSARSCEGRLSRRRQDVDGTRSHVSCRCPFLPVPRSVLGLGLSAFSTSPLVGLPRSGTTGRKRLYCCLAVSLSSLFLFLLHPLATSLQRAMQTRFCA